MQVMSTGASHLVLAAVVALVGAPTLAAQAPLSLADFEWTFLDGEESLGTHEIDLVAGTIFAYPVSSCLCSPSLVYETVAPYDGTVTVSVTIVAHDPGFDHARYVVGDAHADFAEDSGEFSIAFPVFGGVTFGLGAAADDCCGSIEVLYHDFSFQAASATPALPGGLDVRLEQQLALPALTGHADIDAVGDTDGDGVVDVLLGLRVADLLPLSQLRLLSGADLSACWTLTEGTVFAFSEAGDFDLDGVPDVATMSGSGGIRIRSGVDGELIGLLIPPDDGANRGLALAGDVDLDGLPDYWHATNHSLHLTTSTGAQLAPLPFPPSTQPAYLGECLARLGDVDGDDLPDVVVGLSTYPVSGSVPPETWVVPSASGLVLQQHVGEVGSRLGYAVADAGDVDGDGVHDVLAGAPAAHDGDGEVTVWSGATGAQIHRFVGPAHAGLGGALSSAGDVDGDGRPELLLGNLADEAVDQQPDGRVELRRGSDGALLHSVTSVAEDDFGRAVLGDLDRDLDGQPEFLAAAFHEPPGAALRAYDDLDLTYGRATLTGSGSLLAGTPWSLRLRGGPPSATTFLVLGLAQIDVPFKGGVLVPSPDLVLGGLPLDGAGDLTLTGTWPTGVPSGALLAFQCWMPDAHGPVGFGASNGVLFQVP
ncbi:MAG: hypothetical protein H6825_08510 [Planctomycetes bacterium]|nr:hypothetical protein [Planctomycetota bacterium]